MNLLVDQLKELGVSQIFFGAGARNSKLVTELKQFKQNFILDERSGSFSALGLSKASNKPVVICTTSGTAVAECLPAVIEAFYSMTKLIIISADRPERLHGTHSPQTIVQSGIFTSYAPTLFSGKLNEYQIKEISYPFHINIEIDDNELNNQELIAQLSKEDGRNALNNSVCPLVVLTEGGQLTQEQINLLIKKNYLFYIECTSNYKNLDFDGKQIQEKTVLQLLNQNIIDLIIKDGFTPFSKIWRELDRQYVKVQILSFRNPKVGLARGSILFEISTSLDVKKSIPFESFDLECLIRKYPKSEIAVFKGIEKSLEANDIVYIGNSMAIRYWQLIDSSLNKIFASRGANGIDGQISTAIGIAMNTKSVVHCVVGDLTFLYDIGSLLFKIPSNLKIHIVNNFGGRIFERVKVHPEMKLEHELEIKKLICGFHNSDQVEEYFVDKDQTNLFWESWNA
jgi:2-succinyl-5-enolpyruvyl-6-hydroxy-3-cyclohexene-1-carboxylate synthase